MQDINSQCRREEITTKRVFEEKEISEDEERQGGETYSEINRIV